MTRQETVAWPMSGEPGSSVFGVERGFAALMLRLTRRHEGRLEARKLRCHYLAANGRRFNWPREQLKELNTNENTEKHNQGSA